MMRIRMAAAVLAVVVIGGGPIGAAWALEGGEIELNPDPVFDPTQTYDVYFSFHPKEIDRLSNVRLVSLERVGDKMFLRFAVLLNNQREYGLLDLATVSMILPSSRPFVSTPDVMIDHRPADDSAATKREEIRSETVREVIREAPPGTDR